MTLGGMIFMALSWGIILFLIGFSFFRMLKKENVDKVGPRDLTG